MSGFVVSLDMSAVAALGHRLEDALREVETEIEREMGVLMKTGQGLARETARIDTAANRDATRGVVEAIPGGAMGILGTSSPHGPVMELGRTPGSKMPPQGALLGWMHRHGVPDSAEFPLRRKIGRDGIKADHNLENTMKELLPEAEKAFAALGPTVIGKILRGGV